MGIPDIFDNQITLLEWPEILKIKNLSRNVSLEIKETQETKEARVIKIEFFGKYHLAPYPPEKYLEYQYGNWKKPIISSDKSVYLTKNFSGISPFKTFLKKIINLIR